MVEVLVKNPFQSHIQKYTQDRVFASIMHVCKRMPVYKTKLPCLIYQNSKKPTTHKKRRNHFPVLSGHLLITDQDKWHLQNRWNLVNKSGPETLRTVVLCKMQELPWDIWHSSPWQFIERISFTYLCKAKALFFIWTLTLEKCIIFDMLQQRLSSEKVKKVV